MKKTLIGLFAIMTLVAQNAFAACPCQKEVNPCDKPNPCEMNRLSNCEDWLTRSNLEDYSNRMNLDDAQKCEAMKAIEKFRDRTQNIS